MHDAVPPTFVYVPNVTDTNPELPGHLEPLFEKRIANSMLYLVAQPLG